MKLVSIVSSGKKDGSGHLGRTLKLVEYFKHRNKKIENVFITNNNDAKSTLVKKKITHFKIDLKKGNKLLTKLKQIKPIFIIIDNYILNNEIKEKIYENFKNILVIDDDLRNKHFCKYYLNYNLLKRTHLKKLKTKIVAKKFLIGHDYFPGSLISSFKKNENRVIIFFGSTDSSKITEKTLKIVSDKVFSNFKFFIIIGKHFKINKKKYYNHNFKFLNTMSNDKFKNLLKKSKYAIGAGGVSLMERILYKLVNLVVITADNQTFGTSLLRKRKIIKYAGKADDLDFKKYKKVILNFLLGANNREIKKGLNKIKFKNGLKNIYNKVKL